MNWQTPAGERILAAASDLFYHRGIGAVGVESVAEAAGVTKKTLYDRFGSKAKLVEAYLRARDERWRSFLTAYVDERGGDRPVDRVLAIFDGLGQWMRQENPTPRGCGFINAAAELTDPHHPGREAVVAQKEWMREYFTRFVREMQAPDTESLVQQLMLLHEGASVAHGLGLEPDPATTARQAAAILLDAAGRA